MTWQRKRGNLRGQLLLWISYFIWIDFRIVVLLLSSSQSNGLSPDRLVGLGFELFSSSIESSMSRLLHVPRLLQCPRHLHLTPHNPPWPPEMSQSLLWSTFKILTEHGTCVPFFDFLWAWTGDDSSILRKDGISWNDYLIEIEGNWWRWRRSQLLDWVLQQLSQCK